MFKKISNITLIALVAILIITTFLTYYPHINYPFPLHVDEWYHISMAQSIAKTGSISHPDPYLAHFTDTSDVEGGYHTLLALIIVLFHPPITAWAYPPAILQAIAILSVFLLVYKLLGPKEALIAALLVALIPSNVTIGGPVFLIPENLALIFIPLALVFAFRLTKMRPLYNYIGLLVIFAFLVYSHPPTAVVLLIILIIYSVVLILSKEADDKAEAFHMFVVIILAGLISVPGYMAYLQSGGTGLAFNGAAAPVNPSFLIYYFVQAIFFAVGIYIVLKSKSKALLSLLITALVLFLVIFLSIEFNINYILPYQRAFMPLFLVISIIASCGYASVLRLGRRGKLLKFGSALLLVVVIMATVYASVYADLMTPYYHLINQQDYQNFLYIKAHFNSSDIAIMNPYTARAYAPITGMHVYVVEPFGPSLAYAPLLNNTAAFFAGNCTNTKFLEDNNISIVYTNSSCTNPNLVKVTNDTYMLNANNDS